MADIAVASGLAKGTGYLYFATKEAIFAALILEGWRGVLDEVDGVFRSDSSRPDKVAKFLERTVAYMATHRELLRLDALGLGVSERNLERNLERETCTVSRLRLHNACWKAERSWTQPWSCRPVVVSNC